MRADAPALSELIFGRKQGLDCLIGHPKSYQFASKKTGARVRFERARPKYVVCRQDQRAGPTPSPLRLKEWLTRSGISGACSVPARQAPDRPPARRPTDRTATEWCPRAPRATGGGLFANGTSRGPSRPRAGQTSALARTADRVGRAAPCRPRRPLDRTATEWCPRARPSAGCKARCKWPPTSDLAQAARVARTARAAPRLPSGWSLQTSDLARAARTAAARARRAGRSQAALRMVVGDGAVRAYGEAPAGCSRCRPAYR